MGKVKRFEICEQCGGTGTFEADKVAGICIKCEGSGKIRIRIKCDMKIIKSATVMHVGWEMDNEAWAKKDDAGKLHLLTTSHGSLKEMTKDELLSKIVETRDSLSQLNGILGLISEG